MPRPSLLLLTSLFLLVPSPAWAQDAVASLDPAADAPGNAEAQRQIELARADLAAGQPERALKAARSAQRLDPDCHDALLVQAEVFAAQEEWSKARAMALAHAGIVGPTAETEAMLARFAEAEPVRADLEHSDGAVLVRFFAREHIEDPIVHWRKANGAWQSEWMERTDGGAWELRVDLGSGGRLSWWVEQGVGDPVLDASRQPFQLAAR